jgi:hypothetical protein
MSSITGNKLNLAIKFKLRANTTHYRYDDEQMLAFAGHETNSGDYFKLIITAQYSTRIVLNLGSGVVSLTHDMQLLNDNQWHIVRAKRYYDRF